MVIIIPLLTIIIAKFEPKNFIIIKEDAIIIEVKPTDQAIAQAITTIFEITISLKYVPIDLS